MILLGLEKDAIGSDGSFKQGTEDVLGVTSIMVTQKG
jgi:hypothetical protein